MPVKIDDMLPAYHSLELENIFVMTESRAMAQDIRPLKVILLNLMPTKIETETQIMRLLSNTPLQVDIELLQVKSHKSKHISKEHMLKFYKTFDDIKDERYDGMIITGAPVEHMPFEKVDYWDELCEILEWGKTHIWSTLSICWGAQAALYQRYKIPKIDLPEKQFGIFKAKVLDSNHPLLRGFSDVYNVPMSRHTGTDRGDVEKVKDLQVLSVCEDAGIHLISDRECRNFYSTGHSEYDSDTLAKEYFRDLGKGLQIKMPVNYFPENDIRKVPPLTWRGAGSLIFTNWLNYFVYQKTPYDLNELQYLKEL